MPRVLDLATLRSLAAQEVGVSDWRTITQEQINQFADVTGDHQWIHIDAARAQRESPYGTTIAHGFLTTSLLPMMINEALEIRGDFKMRVNYGFNRLRFTGAVPAGARIRARFTLNSVKDVEAAVEISWGVTIEVESREKPAVVAEWLSRLYY